MIFVRIVSSKKALKINPLS